VSKQGLVVLMLLASGCSFYARGPDDYRKAVREVLAQKQGDVEGCYRRAHEGSPELKGKVVVRFDVEPKTGHIVNPLVVAEQTNANEVLQHCVTDSLSGLALAPADQRKGEATFAWNFE
jgi:hypothetical protein